jgi:hypothetical protein
MSGTTQVLSSDCSFPPEAEQSAWQADALEDLTSLRKKSRYTLAHADEALGIILNVGREHDLGYSLVTLLRRLGVSSRQPFHR